MGKTARRKRFKIFGPRQKQISEIALKIKLEITLQDKDNIEMTLKYVEMCELFCYAVGLESMQFCSDEVKVSPFIRNHFLAYGFKSQKEQSSPNFFHSGRALFPFLIRRWQYRDIFCGFDLKKSPITSRVAQAHTLSLRKISKYVYVAQRTKYKDLYGHKKGISTKRLNQF